MSKLNVNGVLFESIIKNISDDRYKEIKKRSSKQTSLIQKYKIHDTKFAEMKAFELTKGTLNKDLNNAEKYIYLSNLIFPDDEIFSNLMLYQGFDKEKLIEINNLIKRIKLLKTTPNKNEALIEDLNRVANIGFGIHNSNILINKANEILVKKPQLLIKK